MRLRLFAVAFIACATLLAQAPEFEAASVKALPPGSHFGPMAQDGSQFSASGTSLWNLMARAYGVGSDQITGPDWMNQEMYSVAATIPQGVTGEQVNLMLQRLLADRFHMAIHRESKVMDGYELVIAKGGSKLKAAEPVTAGPGPRSRIQGSFGPNGATLTYEKVSTPNLASDLSFRFRQLNGPGSPVVRVVDKTDLPGVYDFEVHYSRPNDEAPGPDLFGAIESQLGLKLQPAKLTLEFVVVDRAEKVPTGN